MTTTTTADRMAVPSSHPRGSCSMTTPMKRDTTAAKQRKRRVGSWRASHMRTKMEVWGSMGITLAPNSWRLLGTSAVLSPLSTETPMPFARPSPPPMKCALISGRTTPLTSSAVVLSKVVLTSLESSSLVKPSCPAEAASRASEDPRYPPMLVTTERRRWGRLPLPPSKGEVALPVLEKGFCSSSWTRFDKYLTRFLRRMSSSLSLTVRGFCIISSCIALRATSARASFGTPPPEAIFRTWRKGTGRVWGAEDRGPGNPQWGGGCRKWGCGLGRLRWLGGHRQPLDTGIGVWAGVAALGAHRRGKRMRGCGWWVVVGASMLVLAGESSGQYDGAWACMR
mmetsp:Transcript_24053/g.60439  ORF Transcript_24053/g.60439 Transcript_24053/m.60439 type:complete len:339 (-) Transcript_24053:72-1088(-)